MPSPSAVRTLAATLVLLASADRLAVRAAETDLRAEDLRCEYERDPIGVDVPRPRLSWTLRSDERGQRQTAWRIVASSAEDRLRADAGDLWDSGRVESSRQHLVPWGGKPLSPASRCFWKVRVWDREGRPSPWSAPASWTMGLLQPDDWKARWIGMIAEERGADPLGGARWIWSPDAESALAAPVGVRWLRRVVEVPEGRRIVRASCWMAGDNEFEILVNGERIGGGGFDEAVEMDATPRLRAGRNAIAVRAANGAERPNPAGLLGALRVEIEGSEPILIATDSSWRTSARAAAGWADAAFDDSGWERAKDLGGNGIEPWGRKSSSAASRRAAPLFRKTFAASAPVRRALLFVCGLGHHEVHLNGEKVGESVMAPGWTNYRKTCLYEAHDVTGLIRPGKNAISVLVGNGMYNVVGGRYVKFKGSFGDPKLILHLRIENEDGSTAVVASDESWKVRRSPIVFNCIYGGEDYDARAEVPGWDTPEADDASWPAASVVEGPGGRLTSRGAPPVRVIRELPPAKVSSRRRGIHVWDLGRNFSGWPRLTVRGPRGATVKLVPGELLGSDGLVSQGHSGSPVWFAYTLSGAGVETWRPRFSYYGFRYVQVEGAVPAGEAAEGEADMPRVLDLRGEFIHSSAEVVGDFACSSDLVNRIHDLILSAIRSNLQSVLTDCPHREKLGWLEVSQLLAGGILYNHHGARFYAKVCRDAAEAQRPDGLVPDIAPEYTVFGGGFVDSPEWGSAMIINPWHIWQWYADPEPIETHYGAMARYAAYLATKASGHIVSHGLGDWYDIGPNPPGESQLTSKGVTATATYFQDLGILARSAELLGRADEARAFAARAGEVRAAFNRTFFRAEGGFYDRNSQTANAMPLVLGIVEETERRRVLESLVRGIRAGGNRVTAGDVGFWYLVRALSDGGRDDVLHDVVAQEEGPGYADQLRKGATTLTEAWDASPSSSNNHCMLGHAEEWFWRGLAGIAPDPAGPGFERVLLSPRPVGGISWVRATHRSVRGPIVSEWERRDGRLSWRIRIPPGSTATVRIPTSDPRSVAESGRPAAEARDVRVLEAEPDALVLEVPSGEYRFAGPLAETSP